LLLYEDFSLEFCPSVLDTTPTNAVVKNVEFMLNSTYKRGLKETFPEKANAYFEPKRIGVKSIEEKQT
jgi:hypothetical protein